MLISFTPYNTNLQNKKYAFTGKLPVPNKVIDPKFDYYYVRTLIDEGNSLKQIADYYKESVHTIRNVLEHFKLKTLQSVLIDSIKDKELLEALNSGKSQKEIAEQFFIDDPGALTPRIKKLGKSKVTQTKVDSIPNREIIDFVDSGMSMEAIAQHYNVSYQFIKDKMKQLGIKTLKQMKSEKEIPLDIVKMHLEKGWSIDRIAKVIGVTPQRLSACMKENGIKSQQQILNEQVIDKKDILVWLDKVKTVKELAEKMGVKKEKISYALSKYKLQIPKLVLPDVKDLERAIKLNPRASADEIAEMLGVEGIAVDRVARKNKLKVWYYLDNNERGYYKMFDISDMQSKGDSPVQIGEVYGLSAQGAKEMMINISKNYPNEGKDFIDIKNLEFKKSPTKDEMLSKAEELLTKKLSKKDIKDIKETASYLISSEIRKAYKISDTSYHNLVFKYQIEDALKEIEKKLKNIYDT